MMRIAAVDDEIHVLERFERLAAKIPEFNLCGLFADGERFIDFLRGTTIDAVFLDIEMPGQNGLELAQRILDLAPDIEIVFITAHPQYALEAFDANAIDYIVKPVSEERLRRTAQRLTGRQHQVPVSEKPYFQCFGSFDVFVDGTALTWKHSKAKEILAYMTHHVGIPLSWDRITEAVWPTFDYRQAQTNFHATMYLLRKRLNSAGLTDIVENSRGNYRLLPEKINSDIIEYEKQLAAGNIARLTQICRRGYMEDNGYAWALARATEIDNTVRKLFNSRGKKSINP